MTYEQVKALALDLTPEEQARLADTLADNLHGPIDPEIEKAQLDEVDRRYREYEEGKVCGIPAEEVFRRLRDRSR